MVMMTKKTGMSLEVVGAAAVQRTGSGSRSVEIVGKAAVENDGNSLEMIGSATVRKDAGSLQIIGKASVRDEEGNPGTHMVHFSLTNVCLACTGTSFLAFVLFARFVYLWQECLLASGSSTLSVVRASVALGAEIGLLVMSILLFLLVPRMIVTWTTALVFKYIVGVLVSGKIGSRQMVKDGTTVAKDISYITLISVFEEGHAVAGAVLFVCFTTTAYLRHVMAV